MKKGTHDLYAVYQKLLNRQKQILRLYFDEYASFLNIPGLDGLDTYLKEKGARSRYEDWRYFLFKGDLNKLDQRQTQPLHTDLMLEIIKGVLDLIISEINGQVFIKSVSSRLERELRLAPYGASDSDQAEVDAWHQDNPCRINACSRWLRAGSLEQHASPFMRDWVATTMSRAVEVDIKRDQGTS